MIDHWKDILPKHVTKNSDTIIRNSLIFYTCKETKGTRTHIEKTNGQKLREAANSYFFFPVICETIVSYFKEKVLIFIMCLSRSRYISYNFFKIEYYYYFLFLQFLIE